MLPGNALSGIIVFELVKAGLVPGTFYVHSDMLTPVFEAVLHKIPEYGIYEGHIPLDDKVVIKQILHCYIPAFNDIPELLENLI